MPLLVTHRPYDTGAERPASSEGREALQDTNTHAAARRPITAYYFSEIPPTAGRTTYSPAACRSSGAGDFRTDDVPGLDLQRRPERGNAAGQLQSRSISRRLTPRA